MNDFASQLVRDLRERNMLIPVIGLVVAIVAVPFLLGGGSSDEAVPVAPVTGSVPDAMTGAVEVDPVVLADVPGLRDYRERLDRFGARNPFKQQMTGGSGESGDGDGSGGGSGSGSGTGGTSTTGGTTPTDTSSDTSSSTGGTSTDTGDTTTETPPAGSEGELKFFQIELDVRVGRPGKAKVLKGVRPLDYLPGKESPVVQFVQGDLKATKAAFVVSPDVLSTEGDGNCDPGRDDCQFLLMREGDEQFFEYGAAAKVFKLEILSIDRVLVKTEQVEDLGREATKVSEAAAQFVSDMVG